VADPSNPRGHRQRLHRTGPCSLVPVQPVCDRGRGRRLPPAARRRTSV